MKNKKQLSNLVPRALSLFIRERTLVAAGHVEMCVKKLRSGGRSSTKFCRQDNEIISGVGGISYFKMALEVLRCVQTVLLSARVTFTCSFIAFYRMVCIKALKKFQVRVAGCHKFLPPRKEKINSFPGK